MGTRTIARVLKVRGHKQQFKLRARAEDLLTAGHTINDAAAVMVTEKLCTLPVARTVCEWVKVYGWTRFSKK